MVLDSTYNFGIGYLACTSKFCPYLTAPPFEMSRCGSRWVHSRAPTETKIRRTRWETSGLFGWICSDWPGSTEVHWAVRKTKGAQYANADYDSGVPAFWDTGA